MPRRQHARILEDADHAFRPLPRKLSDQHGERSLSLLERGRLSIDSPYCAGVPSAQ